jgi:hypothetical protein
VGAQLMFSLKSINWRSGGWPTIISFWKQANSYVMYHRYLYFFEKGNPQITSSAIQGLIELITTEMQGDNAPSDPSAEAFLASTMRYIQFQKQKGGSMGEKYEPIKAS